MNSVFSSMQSQIGFWAQSASPQSSAVLHSGPLLVSKAGTRQEVFCHLTATHFFMSEGSGSCSSECGDLRWSVLFPFEDVLDQKSHYGFTLCTRSGNTDFFAHSQTELEQWLDHLEPLCVLTNIQDDFTIIKEIGAGGQARIYLAENRVSGELVAVKCFDKTKTLNHPKRLQALIREVDILRTLKHPRVLELLRVYEDAQSVYLVTEFVGGQDMHTSLVSVGMFTRSEAGAFVTNFLQLLDFFATSHILHRDLKPENILLPDAGNRGEFKVIDFGFAMRYEGGVVSEACGSPGYVAPEIILDRKHEGSVDVYSAGILFFIVLSGYSPFYARSRQEVLELNAEGKISFGDRWNGVPNKYRKLVCEMTSVFPYRRKAPKYLIGCLKHENYEDGKSEKEGIKLA